MPEETELTLAMSAVRAGFEAAYKNEIQEIYIAFGEDHFDHERAFKQNPEGRYEWEQVQSAWWAWHAWGALDKAGSPVKRFDVCGLIESGTVHRIRGFMLNNGGFMNLDQLAAFEAKDAQPRKVTP